MTAASLTTHVRRALEIAAFPPQSTLLVAVSGGADSTACLHALALLRTAFSLKIVAHGVDHQLRPEAAADLDRVEALAVQLDVPFSRTRVTVGPGGDLHQRARNARYEALDAAQKACDAAAIVTAHHRDDRTETVLERLLHGAHLEGLAVLPLRDGNRFRPLREATRNDVLEHCARHALTYVHDASNDDRRFLRARIRNDVLPILREISPQVDAHLAALADDVYRRFGPVPDAGPLDAGTRRRLANAFAAGAVAVPVLLPGGISAVVVREPPTSSDPTPRASAPGKNQEKSTSALESDTNSDYRP